MQGFYFIAAALMGCVAVVGRVLSVSEDTVCEFDKVAIEWTMDDGVALGRDAYLQINYQYVPGTNGEESNYNDNVVGKLPLNGGPATPPSSSSVKAPLPLIKCLLDAEYCYPKVSDMKITNPFGETTMDTWSIVHIHFDHDMEIKPLETKKDVDLHLLFPDEVKEKLDYVGSWRSTRHLDVFIVDGNGTNVLANIR
jgi:hypothetical protein